MKSANDLIKEFDSVGVSLGSEFFLPYPKALEFIDECAKNELGIVGIEGFTHIPHENKLVAHLDMIADFSEARKEYPDWNERVAHCHRVSHEFIQTLCREGKPLEKRLFNFVVLSEKEW